MIPLTVKTSKNLGDPMRRNLTISSRKTNNGAAPFVEAPTPAQLRRHFFISTVPFIGFGFMDNTVMIHAGNEIDCSLGVMFGLSTLTAAAIGQIVANGASVLFGGYVERTARSMGLPSAGFTSLQRQLSVVRRVGLMGNFVGCLLGSCFGLLNLLWIDTSRSSTLKLEALTDEQEFAFEVEASNTTRSDATTLTVRGPDVDGLLASMTAALTAKGCSLVELHASNRQDNDGYIEDIFVVRPRGKPNQQIDDGDLEDLAHALVGASKDPLSAHTLKAQVTNLEATNEELRLRINKLEKVLEDRQITLVPAH